MRLKGARPRERRAGRRSLEGWGRIAFVGLGALALTATEPAWADGAADFPPCKRETSQADLEGAAGAHKAAKAYYERGDYEKAIERWREAYSFDCTKPAVFLNLANAYERKGDRASTLAMLEIYLERAKDPPDGQTIAIRVQNLKASLKTEPAPVATTPPPQPTVPPPPPVTAAPEVPPAPTTQRPYGVIPWIVAGGGAALSIAGLAPLVVGMGQVSDAEKICGVAHDKCPSNPTRSQSQKIKSGDSGQTLASVGGVMIIGGAAVLVGGLVWQFVLNKPQPVASTGFLQITPTAGPGAGGLSVTAAF